MKKVLNAVILLAVLTLSGCSITKMAKLASDQQINVNPNPLELHGDSVKFDMSATLPVKMLVKEKEYILNVVYQYGDQELALESIVFKADDYPQSNESQPTASESFSFAYTDAMKSGSVVVKGVARDPRKDKEVAAEPMTLAPGVITTSQLVKPVYYAAYAGHGYNNQEELLPTNIDFFFDQGRSNLKYSERRSKRGKEFEAFIAEKNVTRTVTITGTHSPEGTERINSKLSEDRATVIEKYYRKQMDKYDYKGTADSIKFILKPIVDDWNGFKAALASYEGVSDDSKSEMLNIVNGPGAFEDKEKALRKVNGYKKVFKDVYPELRTAKTEILNVKEKKTDAEISVLAKGIVDGSASADTLSIEELMYAASLTPDLSEKEGIYKAAITKADSWNAHANLAATYVSMANEDAAKASEYATLAETQVDLANGKQESAQAYATGASVYAYQGNFAKAQDALAKASSLSADSETTQGMNGVKGYLEVRTADYKGAVASLSSASTSSDNAFNLGLAYLLDKDYDNALSSFGDAVSANNESADAYYALAVTQARKGNADKVIENLKQAISLNAELKGQAIKDLEFQSYVANAGFAALLQ
ncbi:MAG: tetratricopeptide repeat protein [Cyclobacteriaceae bacterium]|nr:tetratricopeptide repeat protein [Cyclobacteriaceae bacterium]